MSESFPSTAADVLCWIGALAAKRGELERAEQMFSDATTLDKEHLVAWVLLAETQLARMRIHDATRSLAQATALDPRGDFSHGARAQELVVVIHEQLGGSR